MRGARARRVDTTTHGHASGAFAVEKHVLCRRPGRWRFLPLWQVTDRTTFARLRLGLSADLRSGSLLVRDVSNVVKPEMFVQDSEYLVTLLVVIQL